MLNFNIKMEHYIKVIIKTIKNMDMEFKYILIIQNMKVFIKMMKNPVMEYI